MIRNLHALSFAFLILLMSQVSYSQYYGNSAIFGSQGTTDGKFSAPISIGLSQDGKIYVVDQSNNRLQVLTQSGNNIGYYTSFGTNGSGPNQFSSPNSVCVTPNGKIYVADGNDRIQVLTQSGTNIGFYATFGTSGSGNGQFNMASGVFVGADDKIYVADYNNHRIQVLTQSGTNIGFYTSFGSGPGSSNSQFNNPSDLFVTADGKIYVSDESNHRIKVLTQSGTNIGFYTSFGSQGSNINQFNTPGGIAVDNEGKIYVAEQTNSRIQILTQSGTNIGHYATLGVGTNGSDANQFYSPAQLAVSSIGKIYIADYTNNRVSVWQPCVSILKQPVAQTVCSGSLGSFSVEAIGVGNLSYSWNNDLSMTSSMQTSVAGTYMVTVSGTCGVPIASVSVPNILKTNVTTILTQPSSLTICGGNLAQFTVSATGDNLTYAWNNGLSTTTSLNTSNTGDYIVTVSGVCGNAISNTASLTVKNCKTVVTISGFTASASLSSSSQPILVSLTGIGFLSGITVTIGGVVLSNITVNGNMITGSISGGSAVLNPNNPTIFVQNTGFEISVGTAISVVVVNSIGDHTIDRSSNQLRVYPNPSTGGEFNVQLSQVTSGNVLEIFDALGHLVYVQYIQSGEEKIHANLTQGIYQLKVGNISRKLVIE